MKSIKAHVRNCPWAQIWWPYRCFEGKISTFEIVASLATVGRGRVVVVISQRPGARVEFHLAKRLAEIVPHIELVGLGHKRARRARGAKCPDVHVVDGVRAQG